MSESTDQSHFFNKVKTFLKKCWGELYLFNNKRKSFISIEFKGRVPHIEVQEKYENLVKWSLRILAFIGILISVVSFPWYVSLALALIFLGIDKILESIVFKFTTIFVQPMPNYKMNSWLAMVFLISLEKDVPHKLGMLFEDAVTANDSFKCFQEWNYFQDVDADNNIQITFVIEETEEYSVYIYPSFSRKSIIESKKKIENDRLLQKREIKEHQQLVVAPIYCRIFSNPPKSSFNLFLSKYRPGEPFEFCVFARDENFPDLHEGKPLLLDYDKDLGLSESLSIIKTHLQIARRNEITEDNVEYYHGYYGMLLFDH